MSESKKRRKPISAQAERDALLLASLRYGRAAELTFGQIVRDLEESLRKPGPAPTPEEQRWLDVMRCTLQAVLAAAE